MKKSYLIKLILLVLLLSLVVIAVPAKVNATSSVGKPEYIILKHSRNGKIEDKECLFANGTPITIEERTDGVAGAKITWNGGEQLVGESANIFGGMHDNDAKLTTSIVMNGGKVKNIIGGGLHKSNTVKSTVIVNDGTVTSVQGAGASSLFNKCGCTNQTWYTGKAEESPCKTEDANVEINGGKITLLVYGGGEGISYTKKATVKINNGDLSKAYVTGAGSNGATDNATTEIAGGDIFVVQNVNRGTVKEATQNVTGGNIEKLYIGGENDSGVTGTITENVKVNIVGKTQIKNFELGKNNNKVIDVKDSIIKKENIKILENTVKNSTSSFENIITKLVEVKIDDKVYYLESGKTIKDLENYNSIIKKDGYIFRGIKLNNENFNENTKINSNIELTTSFTMIPKKVKVSVKAYDQTSITLKWNKTEGAEGYAIYMATSKNGKYSKIKTVTGNTLDYKKTKLKTANTYYFKIRAYVEIDGSKKYGEYSTILATSTKTKTPSLKIYNGDKKATLKWNKVSGANGYEIYMATSKNGKYSKIKTISKGNILKYKKTKLKADKKYYFKIRAYRIVDGKKVYSSYSSKRYVRVGKTHKVKKGDTLTKIAKKYKTTVRAISKINGIKKTSLLKIGLKLLIVR